MQRALLPDTYDAEAVYQKVEMAFEFLVKSVQNRPAPPHWWPRHPGTAVRRSMA